MPAQRISRRTGSVLVITLLLVLLCDSRPARAFDTGPHYDMTRAVFEDEGFSSHSAALRIAQLSNWLVDYNSLTLSVSELQHFHFDNHTSVDQIRNSWSRLALNTQRVVRAAARDVLATPDSAERQRRLIRLAVLIGASLHPVQDFYSHSNWVEIYPRRGGVYGTRTWFDTPSPSEALHTGRVDGIRLNPTGDPARDHGDYGRGMNHDSYDRPEWSQAYVYAYAASRQWLAAIRHWVQQDGPGVWQELAALHLSSADSTALEADLTAAYEISVWAWAPLLKDGAWKGRGSGSGASLVPTGWWAYSQSSVFVELFQNARIYRPLVADMEKKDTNPGVPPEMPAVTLARRAVEVRTLCAAMTGLSPDLPALPFLLGLPGVASLANPLGVEDDAADLFAVVSIAGQSYTEATQQGRDSILPSWLSVGFVPDSVGTVAIRYALFDEDGGWAAEDDAIDVNPAEGRVAAEFRFDLRTHALSGEGLAGIYDTQQRAVTLQGGGGDPDPAVVALYVTEHALEDPHVAAAPPADAPAHSRTEEGATLIHGSSSPLYCTR